VLILISAASKAKIIWQCRRGMLELDLILNRFTSEHLNKLTAKQLSSFEQLLTYPDPDIYQLLMGNEVPFEQELVDIVTYIRLQSHI
jgi:antitoxin CptB